MTIATHKRNSLIMWDMSGSLEGRRTWRQTLEDQKFSAIVFVIDAHAMFEVAMAKIEFFRLLESGLLDDSCAVCILGS